VNSPILGRILVVETALEVQVVFEPDRIAAGDAAHQAVVGSILAVETALYGFKLESHSWTASAV
jgi:hypothetical protein